jgi:hypothetical protein
MLRPGLAITPHYRLRPALHEEQAALAARQSSSARRR